jgi:hypothetical protein
MPLARTLVVALLLLSATPTFGAELTAEAARAFAEYEARAEKRFVERARTAGLDALPTAAPTLRNGGTVTRAAQEDGILEVPGGLVHHWLGAAFIRGVTLKQVLGVSSSYGDYHAFYKSILASRILDRTGDRITVLMRLREGVGSISATLDIRSVIQYVHLETRRTYALSRALEIREVEHAGQSDERQLPEGRDSGYLWRASTFTVFVEHDEGVYVEMETLGLSRRFPPMLGWVIEPIARRLGRKSVEGTLEEFRTAVLGRTRRTR